MVLSSQRSRDGSNRIYRSPRRSSRRRWWAILVLLAVVVAVVWLLMSGDDDGEGSLTLDDSGEAVEMEVGTEVVADGSAVENTVVNDNVARDLSQSGDGSGFEAATALPVAALPVVEEAESEVKKNDGVGEAIPVDVEAIDEGGEVIVSATTASDVAKKVAEGRVLVQRGELVNGRKLLNEALAGEVGNMDAVILRRELGEINKQLVFSPQIYADDFLMGVFIVKKNDRLATIAPAYHTPWQFIKLINQIHDERRIQLNARLKVVHGPFHAVVHKGAFRMDVYLEGADGRRMYIRSFDVGLGKYNSTPGGEFIVQRHSKLTNPRWVNPRTSKVFYPDDPANPIGEYWIGLRGIGEGTKLLKGYGIHGTIEPGSIGREASMGCIRLTGDDIELLYSMLNEDESRVTIIE